MSLVEGIHRQGIGNVKWFCLVFDNKMIMISYQLSVKCMCITCLQFAGGRACEQESRTGEFCTSSAKFCRVDDLAVPFQSWCLFH